MSGGGSGSVVVLSRDVAAAVVPSGDRVTLKGGERAEVTQELGGSYTVLVNGNLFRIEHGDGDALGREVGEVVIRSAGGGRMSDDELEGEVWRQLRTCYDPEIPVNVVDLGLIYDCVIGGVGSGGGRRVDVKMTLTAPGCGMGPMLQQDVRSKLLCIEDVEEANVELVWEPQWNQGMMSEAAQLQLGLL